MAAGFPSKNSILVLQTHQIDIAGIKKVGGRLIGNEIALGYLEVHTGGIAISGLRIIDGYDGYCSCAVLSSLLAFKSDGYFIDIGIPEDFVRAQRDLPQRLPHGQFGCGSELDVIFDKLAERSGQAVRQNVHFTAIWPVRALEEIQTILSLLPEPSATAFAVAAFMGLRRRNSRPIVGELPGRGIICFPFDLEWARLRPQNSQGSCPGSCCSTTGGSVGTSSAARGKSDCWSDLRQQCKEGARAW